MNIFQKLLLKSFNILLVLMTLLSVSVTATAANGKQVFIPIDVGGITTFIPVLPSPSNVSISISSATVGGDVYDLTWNTVSNAAYYQVVVEDENGTKRIVETDDLSYSLAGLPLGSNTVSLLACNSEDYCGATAVIGTYNATERVRYAHADILGSPILETDQAGNVISESHYKPFGETEEEKRDDIGYTGHLEDTDLQLTYMQARYYDPVVGRFYVNDPVGFTGNPHSFNRYAYGNNNPYKYTDPDGKYAELAVEAVSLGMGLVSLNNNLSAGNYVAAAVDALGVVADGVLAVVPVAPGVAGMTIQSSRQSANLIQGTAQNTKKAGIDTTHASTSERVAGEMATSGEYSSVHLNQTVKTITDGTSSSRVRPDVAGVRTDNGKVDVVEVLSPSQTSAQMETKITNALGDSCGSISCIDPD